MQHLKVSGAVRPQKWSLGVKWLKRNMKTTACTQNTGPRNIQQSTEVCNYFIRGHTELIPRNHSYSG